MLIFTWRLTDGLESIFLSFSSRLFTACEFRQSGGLQLVGQALFKKHVAPPTPTHSPTLLLSYIPLPSPLPLASPRKKEANKQNQTSKLCTRTNPMMTCLRKCHELNLKIQASTSVKTGTHTLTLMIGRENGHVTALSHLALLFQFGTSLNNADVHSKQQRYK